jgi:hypothetical protein
MEEDILYNTIENFKKNSELILELDTWFGAQKNSFDGKLKLQIGSKEHFFFFEIRKNISLSRISDLDHYSNHDAIIIADYISKPAKSFFKKHQISYLDMAGNAFIVNGEHLFINIETNKNLKISTGKPNRAFSKTGLKVIYQTLVDETIVNMPYRHISKVTKVSIDTVGKVFKELLQEKYLIQVRKKVFQVQNKERLFQEWVTLFNRVLRPKLKQRTFAYRGDTINALLETSDLDSIGGELAAEHLSKYLIAQNTIIYTDEPFFKIAKKMNLIPSSDGSVTIVEKFWGNTLSRNDTNIVHPILVYADLLNSPSPRNLETAKIIYNKYVKNIL